MSGWARREVAAGNGFTSADDLPRFRRHVHPETGTGHHRSWADCANSYCTWAGSYFACGADTINDHTGDRVSCELEPGHDGAHESRTGGRYLWGTWT